jgi:hypothetical protein
MRHIKNYREATRSTLRDYQPRAITEAQEQRVPAPPQQAYTTHTKEEMLADFNHWWNDEQIKLDFLQIFPSLVSVVLSNLSSNGLKGRAIEMTRSDESGQEVWHEIRETTIPGMVTKISPHYRYLQMRDEFDTDSLLVYMIKFVADSGDMCLEIRRSNDYYYWIGAVLYEGGDYIAFKCDELQGLKATIKSIAESLQYPGS